jgi:hypothetical protein
LKMKRIRFYCLVAVKVQVSELPATESV